MLILNVVLSKPGVHLRKIQLMVDIDTATFADSYIRKVSLARNCVLLLSRGMYEPSEVLRICLGAVWLIRRHHI